MPDQIANRRRVAGHRLGLLGRALRENGPVWTVLFGLYYCTSSLADGCFRLLQGWATRRGLPGLHSPGMNRAIWEAWDWQAQGEEWTPSAAWKASLVAEVLEPNVPRGVSVLEIGPGGGRWTEFLIERAKKLVAVDISSTCVQLCQERFGEVSRAQFLVTDGVSLAGVPAESVEVVWSFDVFVHINAAEIDLYLGEIDRVLVPGGRAVIHHGTCAGRRGGWRSDLTSGHFEQLLAAHGFTIVDRLHDWKHGGDRFDLAAYDDRITVFEKPSPFWQV